jgi:hypothetical protein
VPPPNSPTPWQLVAAYPSSFRAVLDLVVGNGLEGDDLRPGQAVPWPSWHKLSPLRLQGAGGPSSAGANTPEPAGGAAASSSGGGSAAEAGAPAGSAASPGSSGEAQAEASGATAPGSEADAKPRRPGPDGGKVQVVLVGATVTDAEVEEAVARHWVAEPVIVRAGSPGSVPSGLRHRALVVADGGRRLAALVAMLRRDLEQAGQDEEPARVRGRGGGGRLGRSLCVYVRDQG